MYFSILSAICESNRANTQYIAHFNSKSQLFYQDSGHILESQWPLDKVKILGLEIGEKSQEQADLSSFIYPQKFQKKLCRQYEKVICEENYIERKQLEKNMKKEILILDEKIIKENLKKKGMQVNLEEKCTKRLTLLETNQIIE